MFLFSCKEAPIIVPSSPEEEVVEVDSAPPIIKWISPRFDAVVKEIETIKYQVIDTGGIALVKIFVDDSLLSGINCNSTSDTTFEILWKTTGFNDGSETQLIIYASDNEGNDTVSQTIRVIVDNKHSYPNPVDMYSIDSIFTIIDTTTTFYGYKLKWFPETILTLDSYFSKYILQRSEDPLMINSSEIFLTSDKSIFEFEDDYTSSGSIIYYRIVVEDIFGKQTPGNVISTSMSNMPLTWKIQSVQYTASSLSVFWSIPAFNNYVSHQLMYSENRDGVYDTLDSFTDSSIFQYQSIIPSINLPINLSPSNEHWFSVRVSDTLGQVSMSQPFMHPHPKEPLIDSVLYDDRTFTIQWDAEPDEDFLHYQVLQSENENPFDLDGYKLIENRTNNVLTIPNIIESEYYLYQIITKDAWELETRGQVIMASSFHKFEKRVGGYEEEALYAVISKDDGGYFSVGQSSNNGAWLVNLGSLGTIEDSVYFGNAYSEFRNITKISNGGYILIGQSRINEIENILVVKIDEIGNQEWLKDYSFNNHVKGSASIELSDGSIGITGYSNSDNNQDVFVLQLDADGDEIWSRTIGGSKSDEGHDILALEDGGMIILGETHSNGDDDGDIWLLKFDSEGNSLDTLLIPMEGRQVGYSFVKTGLNEYVIGGITSGNIGVTDAFIIKVNELGEVEWNFSFGGIYNDIGSAIIYSDGGWVLVGQTYSYDVGGGDILLLKVSDSGELSWVKTIGGSSQDFAYDIKLAQDLGYIISGSTYSQNNTDGWLIKTDSRGNYKGMLEYPQINNLY